MAASAPDSIVTARAQESVSAVVELVQAKLDGLLERKDQLKERIQNLQQVIYGLQEIGWVDSADVCVQSSERGSQRARNHQAGSGLAVDWQAHEKPQSYACAKTKFASPALRRACRIALLEAEGSVSVKDIHSRIQRRGSFGFGSLSLAHPLIFQTLNIMTEEGEVRCLKNGMLRRWQRVVRPEE